MSRNLKLPIILGMVSALLVINATYSMESNDAQNETSQLAKQNALRNAIIRKSLLSVRVAIAHGTDVNSSLIGANFSHYGYYPLYWALLIDSPAIIIYLLECNADINVQDCDGATPLHIAVRRSLEQVRLLLQYQPDANKRDKNGKTALDCVRNKNDEELISCLRAYEIGKVVCYTLKPCLLCTHPCASSKSYIIIDGKNELINLHKACLTYFLKELSPHIDSNEVFSELTDEGHIDSDVILELSVQSLPMEIRTEVPIERAFYRHLLAAIRNKENRLGFNRIQY